jgi:hypothetical protein
VEEREAVVLKVRLNEAKFLAVVDDPANIGSSFCQNREEKPSPEASVEIAEPSPALQRRDSFTPSAP